jgi:hypothetical protein
MNDHELDEHLRDLAQSYNEPPDTPRDTMWARIESARRGATPVALGAARQTQWLRSGAGIAAVLLVGLGIGVGRWTRGSGEEPPGSTVASTSRSATAETATRPPAAVVASVSPTTDEGRARGPRSAAPSADATNPVRAMREERLRALTARPSERSRALAAYGVGRSAPGAVGEGSEMSAYRLAVIEHMARTEVLLTSFLAESRNVADDTRTATQFASLSRDLLKTTRLLLATSTVDDPALTRLLEDLELVLMQISQYTAERRRGDLDAINQSLDRHNVLPKLRSTIPAGASASTGT